MGKLKRIAVWLSRMRYSRGFGVQSPSAYQFIRYVVNEHYPYHAYDDLRDEIDCSSDRRRLLELYFRLANFQQAKPLTIVGEKSDDIEQYVKASCKKASLRVVDNCDKEELLANQTEESMLVVEDIMENKERQALWQTLLADIRTGVSYDLYYCGIIFFDLSKFKRCYKVNF